MNPTLVRSVLTLVGVVLMARDVRAQEPAPQNYWVYVGGESADQVHRVRFGPSGVAVERSVPVGASADQMEGTHGLQISADGHLHVTTGLGTPDARYWRYRLGPDTLLGSGAALGTSPATLDVTPDGQYAFIVNYNLLDAGSPASVSVVHTPTHREVARTPTCAMPQGSRVAPDGRHQYSTCLGDDQLVELDARTYLVSRRFSLMPGREGALPVVPNDGLARLLLDGVLTALRCSPTWAQPSPDGLRIYVACNMADEILEIDRRDWRVTRRFETGRGPFQLAVSADSRMMVVTLKQGNAVQVFDLPSGNSLTTVQTATPLAHGVVISPDGRYAFVTSEGVGAQLGMVDVVDLTDLVSVASLPVGLHAAGIAFWKMELAR